MTLILCLFTFIVLPVKVKGTSMMPTIYDGDFILMTGITSHKQIYRFDIVDVRSAQLKEDIIKRVIGLPGEEISYKNDRLYINGQFVEEPFLKLSFMQEEKRKLGLTQYTRDFRVKLKQNEYFLLGDNRPFSYDSRYFGPIHIEDIRAKNGYIIYPIKHIKSND
ncbi:signal peptidase I [uncultured Catenibacterium sp.]|nr:signal peptidase I [uncultured Catenibacterium sp.]